MLCCRGGMLYCRGIMQGRNVLPGRSACECKAGLHRTADMLHRRGASMRASGREPHTCGHMLARILLRPLSGQEAW